VVLQIDRFTAAPLYDTERLVYQPGPYKWDVYNYHRWQSDPAELVTYYLARDLRASGRFAAVLTETGRLSATHFMTGTVDEILENDTTNGWQAVIGITVTLSKAGQNQADKAIIFQKSYRRIELSASRSPSAVVAAMSTAMAAVSEVVFADVYAALSDEESASGH
jgi:cholesterol transport system auxiliary component